LCRCVQLLAFPSSPFLSDVVWGGDSKDLIFGGSGDDLIDVSFGHDVISLGAGNDFLTYHSVGDDSFSVTDFSTFDLLSVNNGESHISADNFLSGKGVAQSQTSEQYFIYDTVSKQLLFDSHVNDEPLVLVGTFNAISASSILFDVAVLGV
jgi:Ca2+-binding RTX toxin-like protein